MTVLPDRLLLERAEFEYAAVKKDARIAYGLWCVVGIFGGHRFYLGDTGRSIAMLFTLGGLGVWALLDGLVIGRRVRAINRSLKETVQNPDAAIDLLAGEEPLIKKDIEKRRLQYVYKELIDTKETQDVGIGDVSQTRLKSAIATIAASFELPKVPAPEDFGTALTAVGVPGTVVGTGVTALEAAEAADLPTELTAITVKV